MSDKNADKPDQPTRRGGLGRGLGALIPSAPLGNASGKGHFWSALDNPPTVDDETKKRIVDDVLQRGEAPTPDADTPVKPKQGADSAVPNQSETSVAASDADADSAVDNSVDEPSVETTDSDVSRETSPSTADSAEPSNTADDVDLSAAAAVLIEIDPQEIRPNPKNPRQVFDDDELSELSASIKEFGLLQPIVVRETADGYELIMGERRLRASKLAELESIPVIVRQTDDDAMLRDALLENIHRVQLHPLEEAAAYQQLIDEFGVTHEQLATRIKRSRPVISNSIRLLKLPARVQNRVAAGVISGSHARALLSLDSSEAQEALATRIVAEGLSVRATEELVALQADDEQKPRRAAKRRTVTAPALGALADKLSDHFDTRALVQLGRSKGKIVVEFASIDDLERIVAMMAPPLATVRLDNADTPATDA